MPSTPTTKSQVQAYQFVLRRMQSALVRRDAVMLNDPMRTHSRATIVGFFLGMIGMIVFVVIALLNPAGSVPEAGKIVIGGKSGTVYVVMGNPKKLYPTFNMASARLLLMAQTNGAKPADATIVDDEQLRDVPRGRLTGIPDGPQLLPSAKQRIPNDWAVCDEIGLDMSLPNPTDINRNETSVFAGIPKTGSELANNEALLAKGPNGKTYLVYRLPTSANQRTSNVVRAEIDPTQSTAVNTALNLVSLKPRFISAGMLNALPEVPMLTKPDVPGAKTPPPFQMNNLSVGDVFSTQPAGAPQEFWVVLTAGIQRISPVVADILRGGGSTSNQIPVLSLDKLQGVNQLTAGQQNSLPVDAYPQSRVTVLDPTKQSQVACLAWNLTGEGTGRDVHTSVYIGNKLPIAKTDMVDVGTPGPLNIKIDHFYMTPGLAAAVRSVVTKEQFGAGSIQLVSDRGMRYGVPDVKTADGLGLDNLQPAPSSILDLLPVGSSLNTQAVLATYDSVKIDEAAKTYPTAKPSAAAAPPAK